MQQPGMAHSEQCCSGLHSSERRQPERNLYPVPVYRVPYYYPYQALQIPWAGSYLVPYGYLMEQQPLPRDRDLSGHDPNLQPMNGARYVMPFIPEQHFMNGARYAPGHFPELQPMDGGRYSPGVDYQQSTRGRHFPDLASVSQQPARSRHLHQQQGSATDSYPYELFPEPQLSQKRKRKSGLQDIQDMKIGFWNPEENNEAKCTKSEKKKSHKNSTLVMDEQREKKYPNPVK
uniref:Uncharacterized protein n=1 Tax=Biomphalaria glabrata TaxID=6526 RepID=A0A2C9KE13_BIOGL